MPVLRRLRNLGVSPNGITWAAIILSISTGLVFYLYPDPFLFLIIPLVLLIRMMLNALDGMMAKNYNLQSEKGELLNELGDVVSDFCLFFPFYFLDFTNQLLILAFLFLSMLNEFTGVLSKAISGDRRYDGPMGKSDRALFIGIICLILYFWKGFEHYVNYAFSIAIVLLIVSTGIRIRNSIKPSKK